MNKPFYAVNKSIYWRKENKSFLFLHPRTKKLIIVSDINDKGISAKGIMNGGRKNAQLVEFLKKNEIVELVDGREFIIDDSSKKDAMAPLNITIQITNNCNLNCVHCHNDKSRNIMTLSLDTIYGLVDQFAKMKIFNVNISGGEPTLVPKIEQAINYITDRGMNCTMSTNNTLMTDQLARKLADAGLRRVHISLDSFDSPVHNAIRNTSNAFESMTSNLKFLTKYGIEYAFVTTLSSQSPKDYKKTIKLARELGAKAHKTNTIIPQGSAKIKCRNFSINDKTISDYIDIWKEERNNLNGKIDLLCETMFAIQAGLNYICPDTLPELIRCGCPAGILTCGINERGDVQPCSFFTGLSVGNIHKESFAQIWNGQAIKKIRDRSNIKICEKCANKKNCGGCRARSFGLFGETNREDPSCYRLNHSKRNRACNKAISPLKP